MKELEFKNPCYYEAHNQNYVILLHMVHMNGVILHLYILVNTVQLTGRVPINTIKDSS